MKIIHCADLHLDSRMESNLTREQARERREELLDTFSRMVEYAMQNRVKVIMIAGDLFDRAQTRKSARNRILEEIRNHDDIDFLYLKGNHDNADFLSNMKEEDIPSNLKHFNEDSWTMYNYDSEDGEVTICGRELNDKNASIMSSNLVLDPARINIVMLHGQVVTGDVSQDEIIRIDDFRGKNIDYLALGHIHKFTEEKLDDRGVYCYCGCLEGRGFDECGRKGFVLIDISEGEISHNFIPFARRTMHEIEVSITPEMSMANVISAMEEGVSDVPADDLVKFVMRGKTGMDLDIRRAKRNFNGRFYFSKVSDQTSVFIDYDSFKNDRSLKGEFVRLLQNQELDEEEKSEIVETGIKAILGEDILE
ncbi:MAG: metallophosphoesterase [Lachnospiraceae bacterium]|nr:metallophosphoesterase [Lachnospiraceae bacterium]